MDAYRELEQLEIDHIESTSSFNHNIAALSSQSDTIFNHVNIFELKPDDKELQTLLSDVGDHKAHSEVIFDVSKVTQKLDFNDIRLITLKTLNPNADIKKDAIYQFNEK